MPTITRSSQWATSQKDILTTSQQTPYRPSANRSQETILGFLPEMLRLFGCRICSGGTGFCLFH